MKVRIKVSLYLFQVCEYVAVITVHLHRLKKCASVFYVFSVLGRIISKLVKQLLLFQLQNSKKNPIAEHLECLEELHDRIKHYFIVISVSLV